MYIYSKNNNLKIYIKYIINLYLCLLYFIILETNYTNYNILINISKQDLYIILNLLFSTQS